MVRKSVETRIPSLSLRIFILPFSSLLVLLARLAAHMLTRMVWRINGRDSEHGRKGTTLQTRPKSYEKRKSTTTGENGEY